MRAALRTFALLAALATPPIGAGAAPPAAPPAPAVAPAPAPSRSVSKFTAPEYAIGNPAAKVTLVEYASASCPHCARFDAKVFPAFKAKYVDTGKVRYVYREFLTPPEQLAAAGFLLARCAGESRYLHVVEEVYAAQPQFYGGADARAIFVRIAKDNGLSEADLDACLNDTAALDALNARMKEAVEVQHITSTPTFIINGKTLAEHGREPELADFDAVIQPLLATAPGPRAHRRRR